MSLAEIIPPALRFFDVQHQVKIFGNGEPRAPPRPARELPLIHDTALIGALVPNA